MLKTITIKKFFSAVLLAGMSLGAQAGTYTQYVNTAIGTGGHGHVFYGANVPFGLVQLGPLTACMGALKAKCFHKKAAEKSAAFNIIMWLYEQ